MPRKTGSANAAFSTHWHRFNEAAARCRGKLTKTPIARHTPDLLQ